VKALYLFFLLLLSSAAYSNDTLTRAQVYNFSVGDTFDYKQTSSGTDPLGRSGSSINYTRFVITSVDYSTDSTLLFIGRKREFPLPVSFETLVIDSLDQYEYLLHYNTGCNNRSSLIDTSMYYNGKTLNSTCYFELEMGESDKFAAALGIVYIETGGGSDNAYSNNINQLLYYSKGAEKWGIPYYVDGGMEFIHYTPIPEHCAEWVRTVRDNIYLGGNLRLQEKIHTGNIIHNSGHAYIELYYSYHNYDNHFESSDSLIGYFRNDTLNRKAGLYQTLTGNPVITYDFSESVDGSIFHIGLTKVDTETRTIWYGCANNGFIEGVGGLDGFWPIREAYLYEPGLYYPIEDEGALTCFSVCGQTLYPTDTIAICDFILAVHEIQTPIDVGIYPNPSTGSWQLSVDENLLGNKVEVYNTEGQLVFQSEICNPKSEINFVAAPGVYLLHVLSPRGNIIRKLVRL